jgi:hypothetical protein
MSLGRILFRIVLILLLVLVPVLVYGWVNVAVSLDHAKQQQAVEHNRAEILRKLMVMTNACRTRTDLMKNINEQFGKAHLIKVNGDSVSVDEVVLEFSGENLKGIAFLGESGD